MTVPEVSTKILTSVSSYFEDLEFKLNKRNKSFERKLKNGITQIFTLLFYDKKNVIQIEPVIRIKINAIEDIYSDVSGKTEIFSTIGSDLFSIVSSFDNDVETGTGKGQLWVIRDESDIEKLIEVIPVYFNREIIRYFEENSSIDRVDYLLNKYPREISIHNWLYPLRANLAIIAAKLNKNPKYDELVSIYEEELEEADETYKAEFSQLKKVLKDY